MRRTVLTLVLVSVGSTASAQTPDREALRTQLRTQAREARQREDYGACASYLDAAIAIRGDTLLRYGAAMCAYLGGLLPEARRHATACMAEPEGDPVYRENCRQVIAQLDELEREPSSRASATTPQPVVPPTPPAPPVRPAAASPRPRTVPVGAITLWAAGGASLVLAGIGAILHSAAGADCTVSGDVATCPNAVAADRAANAGTWATVANVGFGVGLAAVAGGFAWWLVDRAQSAPRDADRPRVTAGIGPTSAALHVTF